MIEPSPIRLADAIRLGACLHPQAHGTFIDRPGHTILGTCAQLFALFLSNVQHRAREYRMLFGVRERLQALIGEPKHRLTQAAHRSRAHATWHRATRIYLCSRDIT